jgi:hypothetical protein
MTDNRLSPLSSDCIEAGFGNKHLSKRYERMLDAIMDQPSESFPTIFNSESELEGAYRFLRNPNVSWQKTLLPHVEATLQRAKSCGSVLVIHDTTEFQFSGEKRREGLGFINQTMNQGFFGHFAFAVSLDSSRTPLGVMGLEVISRKGEPKRNSNASYRDKDRESLRWNRMVSTVRDHLCTRADCIHVMDREADIYGLLDTLCSNEDRFVIRLCHDRVLNDLPGARITDALATASTIYEKEVKLSRRTKKGSRNSRYPQREGRVAKLSFSACSVEVKRTSHSPMDQSPALKLNVVHVKEVDPPESEERVEWRLVTSEPIDTIEQVAAIVDIYQSRWLIEEYFKAIKTGCQFERRQLESLQTLLNALALFVPVAHRLLLLRNLSRTAPNIPATTLLTFSQLKILRTLPNSKLVESPSVKDALCEIARLGGHIKNNGDPGWLTIWRGYRKLLMYEVGWLAKSDQ